MYTWKLLNWIFGMPYVYDDYWYWNVGWNMIMCDWKYDKRWWMRCWFEMNKHWCYYLDDKVVMVRTCVVDGALKEYLRPTRGEIKCKGENLFIARVLWS